MSDESGHSHVAIVWTVVFYAQPEALTVEEITDRILLAVEVP